MRKRTSASVARTRASVVVVVVVAGLNGLPSLMPHAVAAPAADAKSDEARAAFIRGNTAYNLGKYGDAIANFEQAYALSRLPEILFNLGQCYRKQWEAEKRSELGRRALHYYEALLREAPSSRVRPDAEQFIAELGPAVAAAETRERQGLLAAARGADALKLAETSFAAGQLQEAAGILDRLLRAPDNGRELLAEAYLLRGRVAAGSGDLLGAEAQFRRALELRPAAEIVDPHGQEAAALEAARRTAAPGGLRLVQAPLGELAAHQPAPLAVKVEGDGEKLVATLELGYRQADAGAFLTARAAPPAPLVIPPAALPAGAHVDYYVRALDEHGGTVAESGTPTLPFRLQVAAPPPLHVSEPPRWYQKWWVWTLVGAAAVGAGAATYAATRPGSPGLVIPGMTNL
jgi:tetratricopeptide (TPR) repeat protein